MPAPAQGLMMGLRISSQYLIATGAQLLIIESSVNLFVDMPPQTKLVMLDDV